jgi:hypothetical protein
MSKGIWAAALVCILGAAQAQAAQPGMSKSKLSNLGLASFEPVSDSAGMEVRGMGRSFAAGAFISTAATTGSGILSYGFATRRPGAFTTGQGVAVANFQQTFNGTSFVFSAQAMGGSAAFGP